MWGTLAVVTVGLAFAYPMQVNGWNQNAHYALVRAIAVHGTPWVDRSRYEIGDLGTGDVSTSNGHTYSNKAPGLALVTVPALLALDAVGMRTTGDPTRVIWALHLWSIVLPAFVLLLLVRWVADRLVPGYGIVAAVALGLGTLVLPFATLFFSHVLAAALAFGAFAVLVYERRGSRRLPLVAAGGALAGYGFATEYPVALAGAVLALYVVARGDVLRRGAAYVAGGVLGTLPLFVYNQWAFGSITHLSYERNEVEPLHGIFGFAAPSLGTAYDLLFSAWGLLPVTPIVAAGVLGGVLLYRRGRAAEALVLVGVPVVQFVYDSGLQFSAFGGQGYPRYLIYSLPFLVVPLAAAFRAFPLTTSALFLVSAFQMTAVTATNPLAAYDGDWLDRLTSRTFSTTAASIVGVTGWYAILPFFAAVLVVAGLAASTVNWPPLGQADAITAVGALAVWVVVAVQAHNPKGHGFGDEYAVAMAIVCGVLVLAASLASRFRGRGVAGPARAYPG